MMSQRLNKTTSHRLRHQIRSLTLAQYQPQATVPLTRIDICSQLDNQSTHTHEQILAAGLTFRHSSMQCVGVQGSCNLCGQYGHFARVCPSSGSQQTEAQPQGRGGQSRGRSHQFPQPRLGETQFRPFQQPGPSRFGQSSQPFFSRPQHAQVNAITREQAEETPSRVIAAAALFRALRAKRQRFDKLTRRRLDVATGTSCEDLFACVCRLVVQLRADVNAGQCSCSLRLLLEDFTREKPADGFRRPAGGRFENSTRPDIRRARYTQTLRDFSCATVAHINRNVLTRLVRACHLLDLHMCVHVTHRAAHDVPHVFCKRATMGAPPLRRDGFGYQYPTSPLLPPRKVALKDFDVCSLSTNTRSRNPQLRELLALYNTTDAEFAAGLQCFERFTNFLKDSSFTDSIKYINENTNQETVNIFWYQQ
ncbi:hypothetical protein F511_25769 [Dorcoceras hygrometricum]|uniref:CCHC-type domain-containing protein n=1 Tax=Dorcoceras hygrometricum TaxID=472368 RepID=A0A2Z7BRC6_9LAMI|nr:hypothetical protein F511_25769 [Dorcoceras hygrometricum]